MRGYKSSDEKIIRDGIWRYQEGDTLSDLQARVIANTWHKGQSSDMYALASTGTIREDFHPGLSPASLEQVEIMALMEYIHTKGPRGPVDGWSDLSW